MTTSGTCERKLHSSRSFWSALALQVQSHRTFYATEPARPNLTKICDPLRLHFLLEAVLKELNLYKKDIHP